jgi:hypothetical protein
MIRTIIKDKFLPVTLFVFYMLLLQSCNNSSDKSVTETTADNNTADTAINTAPYVKPETGPVNKFIKPGDAERQEMIIMQIDSTYEAISLLDDAKKEMTEFSPAELTVTERNKKSKAIFNINIIQNELTRSLDAAILANLRVRTNELAGITAELQKNVGHLQSVTEKLNKATLCIGRLTNILALGLSKGIIKPFTPKTSSAEAVKAAL